MDHINMKFIRLSGILVLKKLSDSRENLSSNSMGFVIKQVVSVYQKSQFLSYCFINGNL